MVVDAEENVVCKARRALFGEDFAPFYDLLKNRLIFLDGGKDDSYFLEHYVLLGNYVRDPGSLRGHGRTVSGVSAAGRSGRFRAIRISWRRSKATRRCWIRRRPCATKSPTWKSSVKRCARKLDRGDSFLNKFLASSDPANIKASLNDVELRLKHQELKLEEFGPQIEVARQKLDFFLKDRNGRLRRFSE